MDLALVTTNNLMPAVPTLPASTPETGTEKRPLVLLKNGYTTARTDHLNYLDREPLDYRDRSQRKLK